MSDIDAEAVQRIVMDSATVGVVVTDATGQVLVTNPAAESLLGPATGSRRWLHTDGEPVSDRHLPATRVAQTGVAVFGAELGLAAPGQPVRWFRVDATPVADDARGRTAAVLSMFVDITPEIETRQVWREHGGLSSELVTRHAADGSVTWVSSAAAPLLGRTPRDLLGDGLWELAHPADVEPAKALRGSAAPPDAAEIDGELVQVEWRLRHHAGGYRWFESRRRSRSATDGGFVALHRDVTDERAERSRRIQAEQRVEATFDGTPVPMKTLSPTGTITAANRAFAELLGRPEAQVVGRPWQEFAHPEDAEREAAVLAEMMLGHRDAWVGERRFLRGDGTYGVGIHHLTAVRSPEGRLLEVAAQTIDVTSARLTETRLEENRAWLRAIVESTSDGIVVVDERGTIELFSRGAEQLFGYSTEEVAGQPISILMTAEDVHLYRRAVQHYLEGSGGRALAGTREVLARHRDGRIIPVEVSLAEAVVLGRRWFTGVCRDVSARRVAEHALRASEQRFKAAFEGAPIGMIELDRGGRIVATNRSTHRLFATAADDLAGRRFLDFVPASDRTELASALESLLSGQTRELEAEHRIEAPDAGSRWIITRGTSLVGDAEHRTLLQLVDITDHRHFEDRLAYLADHDALTGLRNRRSFDRALHEHCERSDRYGPFGAVLLLDLDNFKYVNDIHGHSAGDRLLVRLARQLEDRLRNSDVLARLGGDEFVVIAPNVDREGAETLARELVELVHADRGLAEIAGRLPVSVSIGVAPLDRVPARPEDVLMAADLAMYDAKDAGRNRYALASPEGATGSNTARRINWLDRIEAALAEDRLEVFTQPILELASGTFDSEELLVRLRTPEGEVLEPATWLYIAERAGLLPRIDRWMCRQAVALLERRPEGTVEVNLSGSSLGDESFHADLEELVTGADFDRSRLVFEITETAAIANIAEARAGVERLRDLGCRFALDDFGAGFASFYYLKHLDFDILKIDGEFVASCAGNARDRMVIRSIVSIATELGTRTVAEHVDSEAVLQAVKELGVTHAQGFHVARPRPLG